MKIIRGMNYARQTDIEAADVHFIDCNFSQEVPHTELAGIKNCIFENCNLTNCNFSPGAVIKAIDCNNSQIDFESEI